MMKVKIDIAKKTTKMGYISAPLTCLFNANDRLVAAMKAKVTRP